MPEFDKEKELQETVLEPQAEQEKQDVSPAGRVETTMTWIDKVLAMFNKYSAKKVLQAILVVFLVVFLALFTFKPEEIFKSYDDYKKQEHNDGMGQRDDITPTIQNYLDALRKQYGLSWVSVWEFHNNTNNLDGLPFIFASLNYESMNPGLTPIAEQFDNVRVSLYPLVTYLKQKNVWYGEVDSLQEIDHTAYYRAKALGIKYVGFRVMKVDGTPNAVLSFAIVDGADMPEDMNDFIQSWSETAYDINTILARKKK